MDYSDLVQASEAADFGYAKWYGALPDARKAEMFLAGYNYFVAENIRHDVLRENPFATEAEIRLRFIKLTQKDDYDEKTFAHIEAVMQDKIEAEWKDRFKQMKQKLGWTYDRMASFIGASSRDALKATVSRKIPAMTKLAICVFEQGQHNKNQGRNPQ